MVESLPKVREDEALELPESTRLDLLRSRERAVGRVYTGSLLTLGGSVAALWPLFQMQWTLPITLTWVGGLLVAGTGLTLIGLASGHLRRFGGRFGTALLTAFGGAGVSALLWAMAGGLEVWLTPGFGFLSRLGEIGVAVFTTIVVLLALIRLLSRAGASLDDDD